MKRLLFITLILTLISVSHAQTSDTVSISQNADLMAIDPQGCLYIVNNSTLYKLQLDGTLQYTYTNNILGSIASIDVDNPLKIMVFYRDAGTILFLNDKLTPIGDAIDLFSKGFTTISLATYSTKNNLIIYDETNTDLVILDFYFKEKERIHYDFDEFHPFLLKDIHERMLLMQDGQSGIFFFDGFGTFEKNIALYSPYPTQLLNEQIFYIKNNQLCSYNYVNLENHPICELPDEVTQALIYRNKLILLVDKHIKIIQLQK
jgi:hypothetical protein